MPNKCNSTSNVKSEIKQEEYINLDEKKIRSETPDNHNNDVNNDNQDKAKSAKKRKKSVEEIGLCGYSKKKVLDHLKEHGCTSRSFEEAQANFKVTKENCTNSLNSHVEEAQKYVHQECNSLSFDHISEWLKLFKTWNLPEHCFFEQAVVVNAIANTEEHPCPSTLGGIDLKSAYNFVGNALLGLPQPEMNAETSKFLANEFEMLINEANTDFADDETRKLKLHLKNNTRDLNIESKQKLSLDPLMLQGEMNLK